AVPGYPNGQQGQNLWVSCLHPASALLLPAIHLSLQKYSCTNPWTSSASRLYKDLCNFPDNQTTGPFASRYHTSWNFGRSSSCKAPPASIRATDSVHQQQSTAIQY